MLDGFLQALNSNFFTQEPNSADSDSAEHTLPFEKEQVWAQQDQRTLQERREKYLLDYVTLDEVDPWSVHCEYGDFENDVEGEYQVEERVNEKVSLWRGNIASLEIDAIVNAANDALMRGGGVCGVIHRNAGSSLQVECFSIRGGCPTGEARITRGYLLPAKYVIHAVGPVGVDSEKLENAYKSILELVLQHNIKTVALCGISTGIYGYPTRQAAPIALRVVREFLEEHSDAVDRIIFCTFDRHSAETYEDIFPHYFPYEEGRKSSSTESLEPNDEHIDQPEINNTEEENTDSTNPEPTEPVDTNPETTEPVGTNPETTEPVDTNPETTEPVDTNTNPSNNTSI